MARSAALPDPAWLIDELVPESGRVTFVAAPSAGKTFLELVAAKAAAAAGRPVYLVLEEGSARGTHDRFESLQFPAGATVYVLHQRGVKLVDHAGELAELLRRHLTGPAPVLALDPFAAIFSGNENDTEQMAAAIDLMNSLMRANPRTLLIVPHHSSKAAELGDGGAGMYSSRGGSGLPAWADVQLNLKHVPTPKGAGLVSFDATMAKNRDGERDYSVRVTISLGDGTVTMAPADEARREAKAGNLRERLVAFVARTATAAAPLSKNKICTGVQGTKDEKLRLIDDLTREGVFVNDGAGWTVAEPAAPAPGERK